jgi:predicted transcriptional regulator
MMQVIYSRGGATVAEIRALISDPPPELAGLRTLLRRMADKGLIKTRRSGRHSELVYLPAASSRDVQLRAFDRLAKEHFRGSTHLAASMLSRLAFTMSEHSAPARMRNAA